MVQDSTEVHFVEKVMELHLLLLQADPRNGPCQRKVLAEYINNNNKEKATNYLLVYLRN